MRKYAIGLLTIVLTFTIFSKNAFAEDSGLGIGTYFSEETFACTDSQSAVDDKTMERIEEYKFIS